MKCKSEDLNVRSEDFKGKVEDFKLNVEEKEEHSIEDENGWRLLQGGLKEGINQD